MLKCSVLFKGWKNPSARGGRRTANDFGAFFLAEHLPFCTFRWSLYSILKRDVCWVFIKNWEDAERQLCFGRCSNSQNQELLTQLTSQRWEKFDTNCPEKGLRWNSGAGIPQWKETLILSKPSPCSDKTTPKSVWLFLILQGCKFLVVEKPFATEEHPRADRTSHLLL